MDPLPRLRKPSIRRRNESPQHTPSSTPLFPPLGIVLHPDDASSKVLLAIARSFLSVDNRAMTIKDLAEMTVTFGLVCQNVSAASQAITTYIRTHMQRCDAQQDQPLLLRHVLSGTASDDDLLPALYSRSGGAQCNNPENRVTNFRRGTVVWYLSRSTGAPCPFARAGIRLCDYGEEGKKGSLSAAKEREKKKKKREMERHEQCGDKRKRPLRGCVAKSDIDEGQPLPKVKLTLRLKPLQCRAGFSSTSTRIVNISKDSDDSDSDSSQDDSMSVDLSSSEADEAPSPPQPVEEEPWSLPPYPRKSISIPSYTPSFDDSAYSSPINYTDVYRRSPSIAYSVGSLPPDSEDEDDDFHISMTGARRHSTAPRFSTADADGWDADSEGDGDMWDSPGPRSPSAPAMLPEITVKEEPTDVQGMLEAWDDFDHSLADAKVAEVIAQAAASVLEAESTSRVKIESLDTWSWESGYNYNEPQHDWSFDDDGETTARIKQEDIDLDTPLMPSDPSVLGPSSPLSPLSQLPSLSYSDSPSPESSRDALEWTEKQYATVRPRAKTQPTPSGFSYFPASSSSSFRLPTTPPRGTTNTKPELVIVPPPPSATHSLTALVQSMSMNSPTAVAPSSLLIPSYGSQDVQDMDSDVVVVHTCQPCTPAISATSIEGISVYQMMLGPFQLLRRIDTDFVNLSPIVAYSGASWPALHTIPNAVAITKGSVMVSGTWVPLSAAQTYVREHHPSQHYRQNVTTGAGALRTFLSDTLFERFPSALQDFHRSSTQGRMLGHFGPHFGSTIQATQLCGSILDPTPAPLPSWETDPAPVPVQSSTFALSLSMSGLAQEHSAHGELPLSPSEQEMFHVLCGTPPEWDKENSPPGSPVVGVGEQKLAFLQGGGGVCDVPMQVPEAVSVKVQDSAERDRPLRRSKRVADAMAAQTQTQHTTTRARSRRGGSRTSQF